MGFQNMLRKGARSPLHSHWRRSQWRHPRCPSAQFLGDPEAGANSRADAAENATSLLNRRGMPLPYCGQEECQNYVRVLIVYGKKVFTCGTNAFSPVCSSRQVGNLSKIIEKINGVARCPYDPRHNSTAVITSQGELYAATVIDFSGRDPAIYRSLGNVPPLRTAQYNSKWLNECQTGHLKAIVLKALSPE
uniref:Semaphorin-5B n=1 Tax=Sphaerodactylus townsendi TaxID=933632 RepID=A0ACB8G2P0_9SAUR